MKSTLHFAVKTTALNQIVDPANKFIPLKKVEWNSMSPMQTYEMLDSDEERDSEEDSEEENNKSKKMLRLF